VILVDVVAGVVGAVMVLGPILTAVFQTDYFERGSEFPGAVAIALAGLFVGGFVDLVVGWIPVVGRLVSPFAWAYVVKHAAGGDWPGSLLVGFVAWALSVGFYAVIALL